MSRVPNGKYYVIKSEKTGLFDSGGFSGGEQCLYSLESCHKYTSATSVARRLCALNELGNFNVYTELKVLEVEIITEFIVRDGNTVSVHKDSGDFGDIRIDFSIDIPDDAIIAGVDALRDMAGKKTDHVSVVSSILQAAHPKIQVTCEVTDVFGG